MVKFLIHKQAHQYVDDVSRRILFYSLCLGACRYFFYEIIWFVDVKLLFLYPITIMCNRDSCYAFLSKFSVLL